MRGLLREGATATVARDHLKEASAVEGSTTAALRRPEVGDITERRQALRHQDRCGVIDRDVMEPR
jgi:hypothetical protein